jgi:hypothetical protein
LKTTSSALLKRGSFHGGDCARCALRKISSTLLLEGASLEKFASRLCGRSAQTFKYLIAAEIRKYQRVGVKSIEITNISTDNENNLVIEFDVFVNPRFYARVQDALRRAVVTLDVCPPYA